MAWPETVKIMNTVMTTETRARLEEPGDQGLAAPARRIAAELCSTAPGIGGVLVVCMRSDAQWEAEG